MLSSIYNEYETVDLKISEFLLFQQQWDHCWVFPEQIRRKKNKSVESFGRASFAKDLDLAYLFWKNAIRMEIMRPHGSNNRWVEFDVTPRVANDICWLETFSLLGSNYFITFLTFYSPCKIVRASYTHIFT